MFQIHRIALNSLSCHILAYRRYTRPIRLAQPIQLGFINNVNHVYIFLHENTSLRYPIITDFSKNRMVQTVFVEVLAMLDLKPVSI